MRNSPAASTHPRLLVRVRTNYNLSDRWIAVIPRAHDVCKSHKCEHDTIPRNICISLRYYRTDAATSRVRESLSESHRRYKPHRPYCGLHDGIAIFETYLRPVCVEQNTKAAFSMTSLTIRNSTNWNGGISRDSIILFCKGKMHYEKQKLLR